MAISNAIRANRVPLLISATIFALLTCWTVLVFNNRVGIQIFLLPWTISFAAALHPCDPPEPYEMKAGESPAEKFLDAIVPEGLRCAVVQAVIALRFSAAFWMGVVPLAVFVLLRRAAAYSK